MSDIDILNETYTPVPYEVWGLLSIAPWKAALVKGEGKVPFDPTQHKNMVWAIDLSLLPIDAQQSSVVERSMIQPAKEWRLTQDAIKALGIQPADANDHYVHAAFEPTGETYVNSEGATKNKTFLKIIKVFKSEDECTQDYLYTQYDPEANRPAEATNPAAGQKEYEAALKLLGATVRTCMKSGASAEKVKDLVDVKIKASPVMSRFFNAGSQEVIDLLNQALVAEAK
ncbi:MAG: hypothetical protein LLG42_03480 [Chloroflexi bacterium]|nr:hypothetical protein [Chloroflexota bacterium]